MSGEPGGGMGGKQGGRMSGEPGGGMGGMSGEPGAGIGGESGAGVSQANDMDPRELLAHVTHYAEDKKAGDLVALDMRDVLGYTDWFVICSGNTDRQTKAIHDSILEGLKRDHGVLPRRVEGLLSADWILMDYLDVVVHIFTPATRDFYRLEQLWGEAPARRAGEASA